MLKKLNNKKGFTLMEMLIVVAIIAVLVAIAIPVFNGALTKSKESADVANIRAAYAEWQVAILTENAAVPTAKGDTVPSTTATDFTSKLQTLNYTDKLSYSYDGTEKTGTITYTPTKLTGGNSTTAAAEGKQVAFTWTLGDPTIQ